MLAVVRQLSLQQTPSGQITYDKWLIVGKDLLKWNDYALQLFWDMLLLALSYTSEEHQRLPHLGGGEVTVDLPSLAIFLVLHASDTPSSKVHTPLGSLVFPPLLRARAVTPLFWPSRRPRPAATTRCGRRKWTSSAPRRRCPPSRPPPRSQPPLLHPAPLPPSPNLTSPAPPPLPQVPGLNIGPRLGMGQGAPPSSPKSPVASPRTGHGGAGAHALAHPGGAAKVGLFDTGRCLNAAALPAGMARPLALHPHTPHLSSLPFLLPLVGQASASSPNNKRVSLMSPRQSKSASHYLCTLRQKLPTILRAITVDESTLGIEHHGEHGAPGGGHGHVGLGASSPRDMGSPVGSPPSGSGGGGAAASMDFSVSRRAVDALGLVIAGGTARDQHVLRYVPVRPLASIYLSIHLSVPGSLSHPADSRHLSLLRCAASRRCARTGPASPPPPPARRPPPPAASAAAAAPAPGPGPAPSRR